MSSLSEAEKRQKLRERRAAKIKNGASRLGKITGDYSDVKEQPITSSSSPTPEPITTGSTLASTKQSNRISQNFDHNDPEIEDISKFEPIREGKRETKAEFTDLSSDAEQFEQMLEKMLSSQQHQHSGGESSAGTDGSEFDIFSKLLSGQGVDGSISPFGAFGGQGSGAGKENNEDNEYEAKLSEYNKILNDQFKAKFMIVKFFITFVLSLWVFHSKGFHSSSYEIFRIDNGVQSGFLKFWLSLEIIFTGIYATRLNKIKDTHYNYNSKILNVLGMVPDMILPLHIKNKIRWFVKYQELINLIVFDLSVVVFVFGVLSFLHRIQV